jgi:hypothetical protein
MWVVTLSVKSVVFFVLFVVFFCPTKKASRPKRFRALWRLA